MPRSGARLEDNMATTSYLIAHNFAQGLGWLFVSLSLLEGLVDTLDYRPAYDTVGLLVRRLQLVSILEVIHAGLGLVRSSPVTALMQWAGRTRVLVAIIGRLPEVQTHYSVCLTFAAWSISEIIRYPQYGLTGIGICPPWLTWLRYTLFIVLYPAGVYGEMVSMYTALSPIKYRDLYSEVFDYLPFTYHTSVIGLLIVYPLLFLVLYRHMFKQRRTKLSPRRPPRGGRTEAERGSERDGQRMERQEQRTDRED